MTVAKPKVCKHRWRPFTKWKGECSRCRIRRTWDLIVNDAETRGWAQGIGYSVAEVVRAHNETSVAADLATAAGYDLADFIAAGVDPYDVSTLRRLRREESVRWRQRSPAAAIGAR